MSSVVLDTHTVVWYLLNSSKLSATASTLIETAITSGELVYLSAISIVEITYLVEKGKLPIAALERLNQELEDTSTGIIIMPLDVAVARSLSRIDRATVPEMGDRIIAATALMLNLPLVTRDQKIRELSVIQALW